VEFGQEFAMRLLGQHTTTGDPFELVYRYPLFMYTPGERGVAAERQRSSLS
jgi:hypothetical protein